MNKIREDLHLPVIGGEIVPIHRTLEVGNQEFLIEIG